MPFLKQHRHSAVAANATEINRLFTQLDSHKFAVRPQAAADLARCRDVAEPLLRSAQKPALSSEVHGRLNKLLQALDPLGGGQPVRYPPLSPARLACSTPQLFYFPSPPHAATLVAILTSFRMMARQPR